MQLNENGNGDQRHETLQYAENGNGNHIKWLDWTVFGAELVICST